MNTETIPVMEVWELILILDFMGLVALISMMRCKPVEGVDFPGGLHHGRMTGKVVELAEVLVFAGGLVTVVVLVARWRGWL